MWHKYTLRETQLCQLNILKEFYAFCVRHDLYCVLCGGTLLGAVRHKGFIPWDDDIDVLMPRPDYDRLMELILSGDVDVPDYLEFATWKNKTLALPIIKLYDKRTRAKEFFSTSGGGASHVWIDIFQSDGAPEDDAKMAAIGRKQQFYKRVLGLRMAEIGKGRTLSHRIFKIVFGWVFKLIPPFWLCQKLEEVSQTCNYHASKFIAGIAWGYGARERIDREAFERPVMVEFEGCEFPAPSNFDEYLRNLYGANYMELPPVEKRVCHELEVEGE